MSYTALEIAKYIISTCSKKNRPISNLKLQKLLYFAWIYYYTKTGNGLFHDDICAWQFGPVDLMFIMNIVLMPGCQFLRIT